ncbi:MAG TPA: chromosomal replication initiator protein DnaA [Acidimicrobiia bacterium]|nr:chromosomal replication initiator protein DnaA [Acidimicrobiia bacterium]
MQRVLGPETTSEQWSEFQRILRGSVSPANWQKWLSRLELDSNGDRVSIVAPSEFHLQWVLDKHSDLIESAFRQSFGEGQELVFVTSDEQPLETAPLPLVEDRPNGVEPPDHGPTTLVGRYRFDNFVVGNSNRFAWAAAMAVAEQPGTSYNPLFIYGHAGLGKTHLLHAVGHLALDLYPSLVVRYVTSEKFLIDFIDCIRRKRLDDFKNRYRSTDVLLLDDVQFFEGKEQILEEFFHTFNHLYESSKQMVISSDRHPRHLHTLETRVRSRFEWGLLTDIQPPDVETRLAILKRNAEFSPRPVPHDVLEFIAVAVADNIRELEGALTRVTAYSALTHREIDLAMAQDVLGDLLPGQNGKTLDAPEIIRVTAESFGFSVNDVQGPSRRQPLVLCRQVAMYLCRELTDLSLPKIGENFGNRDHTTVIHSVEKVKRIIRSDRSVFDRVHSLSQQLRKP